SFQAHGMEVATCVQESLGVVFAVFNDGRMRSLENPGGTIAAVPERIDFAALARALGAKAYTIRTAQDLRALPAGLGAQGIPIVLDVSIDPTAQFPAS